MNNDEQQQRWSACLERIKAQVGQQAYDTWFAPLRLQSFDGVRLLLLAPNKFFVEKFDSQYIRHILPILHETFGKGIRIQYTLPRENADEATKPAPAKPTAPPLDPHLNTECTFDTFVRGAANKTALSIAISVAESPNQQAFNPFFVYGASGVGKTHLVNAIGNKVISLFPEKRVLYVPAHIFYLQFTDAAREGKQNDFIHFYQTIDLLIIDDFQEITTAKTQSAFFHIFNHLQLNGRKIVITSDRSPSEFTGIEERMLTRLKWGAVIEIERPDIVLRRAILQNKIKRDGLTFPREVINYIAENVSDNVRDLQGAINSILAYSFDESGDITVELAKRCVSRIVNVTKKELRIDAIINAVCKASGIRKADMTGKSRKREIAQARQLALYLGRKYTDLSYNELGRAMGGRDHTTVLHSCEQIEKRLAADKPYRLEVELLEAGLKK